MAYEIDDPSHSHLSHFLSIRILSIRILSAKPLCPLPAIHFHFPQILFCLTLLNHIQRTLIPFTHTPLSHIH